jgi:hypothetical protein
MQSDVSKKLLLLMASEMGTIGKFIIKKQCDKLKLDSENLSIADLTILSSALAEAVRMFTGEEKAQRMRIEIRKISNEE